MNSHVIVVNYYDHILVIMNVLMYIMDKSSQSYSVVVLFRYPRISKLYCDQGMMSEV